MFIRADVSFIRSAPISTTSEQGQLHTMRQTAVVLLSSNHFPKLFCFASFLDFTERKGCNPSHIAINTLPAMEHQKGVTKNTYRVQINGGKSEESDTMAFKSASDWLRGRRGFAGPIKERGSVNSTVRQPKPQ